MMKHSRQLLDLKQLDFWIAYAAQKGFMLYQMDVKTTFLNGYLQEEVYVEQTLGFENSLLPNHMFKLEKALYGLKKAPRAWYDRLSQFIHSKGYKRGMVDKTLFTLQKGEHILLVQVYVDDIIFCSTN